MKGKQRGKIGKTRQLSLLNLKINQFLPSLFFPSFAFLLSSHFCVFFCFSLSFFLPFFRQNVMQRWRSEQRRLRTRMRQQACLRPRPWCRRPSAYCWQSTKASGCCRTGWPSMHPSHPAPRAFSLLTWFMLFLSIQFIFKKLFGICRQAQGAQFLTPDLKYEGLTLQEWHDKWAAAWDEKARRWEEKFEEEKDVHRFRSKPLLCSKHEVSSVYFSLIKRFYFSLRALPFNETKKNNLWFRFFHCLPCWTMMSIRENNQVFEPHAISFLPYCPFLHFIGSFSFFLFFPFICIVCVCSPVRFCHRLMKQWWPSREQQTSIRLKRTRPASSARRRPAPWTRPSRSTPASSTTKKKEKKEEEKNEREYQKSVTLEEHQKLLEHSLYLSPSVYLKFV